MTSKNERITLTQQEICNMIVAEIGIHHKGMCFFPYRIIKTNIDIPETVSILLEYVPQGSKTVDFPHLIDKES